ncbi:MULTISPECIES: hypothetical protein [unclassified Micromonospora]|uniref:hypothetical protein n=1 Tax=unclassified Micromonospora TaxID=2617518 RepID=UPI003330026A
MTTTTSSTAEHRTDVSPDPTTGSYRWSCSCGDGSRPVLPSHAARDLARSHEQSANASQIPDQPDGISEQSRDLPDLARAAERVNEYIGVCGDGLYDVRDRQPLYARDLTALVRLALSAGAGTTGGDIGTFADIDRQVTLLENQIADLRTVGARVAADSGMSGTEIMGWLKQHGAADDTARTLCVEIIHERRAASKGEERQP